MPNICFCTHIPTLNWPSLPHKSGFSKLFRSRIIPNSEIHQT